MAADWVKIIDEATEAACENVWNEVHGDLMGPWPDGCPNPEEFRREEREALTPAIGVFKDRGVLIDPEAIYDEQAIRLFTSVEEDHAQPEGRVRTGLKAVARYVAGRHDA